MIPFPYMPGSKFHFHTKHGAAFLLLLASQLFWARQNIHAQLQELTLPQIKTLILSPSERPREGFNSFTVMWNQASEEQKAQLKGQLADWTLGLLKAPVTRFEVWNVRFTPRVRACSLAGLLKLETAVPQLIQLLSPLPRQREFGSTNMRDPEIKGFSAKCPAIRPLIEIGQPAKAPLEAELRESDKAWPEAVKKNEAHKLVSAEEDVDFYNEHRKREFIRYVLEQIDAKAAGN